MVLLCQKIMQGIMRYGLPYKGSKNLIAAKIVAELPAAETFVDLFCGGGAVTHAAMLSGKYDRFIMNDIDGSVVELFAAAVRGKYRDEKRWISREDFFKLKDTDAYVRLCWSFGNNSSSYLYSKDIEPWKKALWYARRLGDNSLLREMGIESDGSKCNIRKHVTECREKYAAWYGKQVNCKYMQDLESLERLQSFSMDYAGVPIPEDAVVYCDIPYIGTTQDYRQGAKRFDHERFYEWAAARDDVYISEYTMPEPFVEVINIDKQVLSTSNGASGMTKERLYATWATLKKHSPYLEGFI